MNREQAFVAEYRVETPELVPLVPALEATALPRVTVKRWWDLMVPGEPEPVATTCRANLARGWRRVGGVTVHHDEREVQPREVAPVTLDAWKREVQVLARSEGLPWGCEDGHVDAYGRYVVVKTPSRLGQAEHLRRRRAVETILRSHGVGYELACITQHSQSACRPLFPKAQEQLEVEPTGAQAGGGA